MKSRRQVFNFEHSECLLHLHTILRRGGEGEGRRGEERRGEGRRGDERRGRGGGGEEN